MRRSIHLMTLSIAYLAFVSTKPAAALTEDQFNRCPQFQAIEDKYAPEQDLIESMLDDGTTKEAWEKKLLSQIVSPSNTCDEAGAKFDLFMAATAATAHQIQKLKADLLQ